MPKSILIADDDPAMLKLYSRIFSGKEYAVSQAETAATASALITANHYDLLITDLMFPDGLGTDLISLFSKQSSGAKSILVSGSLGQMPHPDLSEAFECLSKPLQIDTLMKAVQQALA